MSKEVHHEKIMLSISLLVSNRIDTIRKCMESLRPILEALPSELIAVDTVEPGRSDGSIEVVREYTENIIPFVWCNDFAAARNAGLERARGEWFMYIDDDEWLEDASPIIDFFKSGKYREYNCANYTVRSYTNFEGNYWVDTLQARLFPIEEGKRFTGKIHEMVPMRRPVWILPCYAHHYGYAFKNAEDKRKHIDRNKAILLEEYRQNKGNCRTASHLVQEYEGDGKFEESLKIIHETCGVQAHEKDGRYWHFLKLHEMLDYGCLRRFEDMYRAGLAYLQGDDLLPGAEVGVNALMMEACDKLGRYEECMHYLETYLKQAEEIEKREDILDVTILDINQLWNEVNRKKAYARGVEVAYRLGNLEKTAYYIRRIDWQEKELQVLEDTVEFVFRYFSEAPYAPWMTAVMDAILARGFSSGSIGELMASLAPDSGERRHLLQILASCENPGVQISVYRAEYAMLTRDKELLCRALGEITQNPDGNPLMLEQEILQYMYEAGIDGSGYVGNIPLYRWHMCVGQWSETKSLEMIRKECFLWRGMMPGEPLYLLDMEAALQEKELQADIKDDRDFRTLHQGFLATAEKFHQVYSRIYHPDAFKRQEMFTILPPDAQFAEKYLSAAGYLEEGDERNYVSLVKEAGICSPARGGVCKLLLEKFEKEGREAETELAVLIQMLKRRAEQMWESGQEEAAKAIIKQILQIRPDAELAAKYHIE